MVTLAILAILTAVALPQFRNIHERWQVRQAVNAMESTLMLARSESIQRGGNIGLRTLNNIDWGEGWFIYEDTDVDGEWNAQNDRLLHEIKLTPPLNITRSPQGNNLLFNRNGRVALNAMSFSFQPNRGNPPPQSAQIICISSGGRIRTTQGTQC